LYHHAGKDAPVLAGQAMKTGRTRVVHNTIRCGGCNRRSSELLSLV